ncbi:MAG: RNA methyltransferase [Lentisphaerae bacterium]|nr:RNA methyltransferase [Lentisphaerota bacterium]
MLITSPQNPRIKDLVRLRDRRGRDRDQKVIIEGYRELMRAVDAGYPLEELYVCPELFQGSNEPALIERCCRAGAALFETTPAVFGKVAYRDRPEGLLAVGPQRHRGLADLALPAAPPPLLLVAEAIEKPGNLGTMLRSADATGVSALVVCDPCTDIFNPNVVRASTGTLFTVPVVEAGGDEALAWLRDHGIRILAASPHAEARYTEVDLTGPVAVTVGTEQYGLSPRWIEAADLAVRIPMLGVADSLNVATATALILYEAVRQRLAAGSAADRGPMPED